MVPALLTACAGFLLAVLWMDLMFDSQVRRHPGVLPDEVLASIAGYYHRATTTSQPMGAAIAVVMTTLLVLLGFEVIRGDAPGWLLAASAMLAGGPIALALTRTVPNAVRLGRRSGSPAEQSALARAVFTDHIACAAGMLTFLVLWLIPGLR